MKDHIKIHLDFETRSFADLTKTGGYRYAEDPTTEILCMGWAVDNDPPELWIPANGTIPPKLSGLLSQGAHLYAWNAEFEMGIWESQCAKNKRWPAIPLNRWHDVMARAAAMSLPLSLKKCSSALGTAEKDAKGSRLISKLCKPFKGQFRLYEDFIDDYFDLYDYCIQDVIVERELCKKLDPLTRKERRVWEHCVVINRRGLPLEIAEVNALHSQVEKQKLKANATLPWLTNGKIVSANQVTKILECLNSCGVPMISLNAQAVAGMIHTLEKARLLNTERAKALKILKIRKLTAMSSTAKLKRAQQQLCQDGTIKNNLVYHGAGTGRYAGRGFQMQNLPTGIKIKDPNAAIMDFVQVPSEVLDIFYPIMSTASSLIRSLIKAPAGYKIIAADYTSIEAWVTPWIANEVDVLEDIEAGKDLYKAIAAKMYDVGYYEVSSIQRQAGKICVLAAGFAGGYQALLNFADKFKIITSEREARDMIKTFRSSRPELVKCWRNFLSAALDALNMKKNLTCVKGLGANIYFHKKGPHLFMKLPSGRDICYPFARVELRETPWGEIKSTLVYDTILPLSHKWGDRIMTGGNLFQNAVQGTARDILVDAQLNLEAAGFPVILSVHDEIGSIVPDNQRYTLDKFITLMTTKPGWASSLPVKAGGWEGYRYHKA